MEEEVNAFLLRAPDEVKESIELKSAELDVHLKKNDDLKALDLAMQMINQGIKMKRFIALQYASLSS